LSQIGVRRNVDHAHAVTCAISCNARLALGILRLRLLFVSLPFAIAPLGAALVFFVIRPDQVQKIAARALETPVADAIDGRCRTIISDWR
jgi:hypothetical protein